MSLRRALLNVFLHEDINFLLTNRIPRRLATRWFGRFSKIEQPLVRDLSLALWRAFADLRLHEARKTEFRSLHECFVRELKPGARTIDRDPRVLASPCDAIVGAAGLIADDRVLQIKGFSYSLHDLLNDPALVAHYRGGTYVTLRLTADMYHRFHAPDDGRIDRVTYISGDTWNVNPIALKRIENLFCRNERAVIRMRLEQGGMIALVPVAAILVASIRLHCLDTVLSMDHPGPREFHCDTVVCRGDELGWFEHGSTIIVFAPPGFSLCEAIEEGTTIRMGQRLLRRDR